MMAVKQPSNGSASETAREVPALAAPAYPKPKNKFEMGVQAGSLTLLRKRKVKEIWKNFKQLYLLRKAVSVINKNIQKSQKQKAENLSEMKALLQFLREVTTFKAQHRLKRIVQSLTQSITHHNTKEQTNGFMG